MESKESKLVNDLVRIDRFQRPRYIISGGEGCIFCSRCEHKLWALKLYFNTINEEDLHIRYEMIEALEHPNLVKSTLLKNAECIYKMNQGFQVRKMDVQVTQFADRGDLWFTAFINDQMILRSLLYQVVLAVEYLHHNSIIHHDIKPENIFVYSKGIVKLGDFGFMEKIIGPYSSCKKGTMYYNSPEKQKQGKYDAKKAEIYGLGVTVMVMCGIFSERSIKQIKPNNMQKIWSFLKRNTFEHEQKLKDLISMMLKEDPADRCNIGYVKNHPWFKELRLEGEQLEKKIVKELSKIKRYTRINQQNRPPRKLRNRSSAEENIIYAFIQGLKFKQFNEQPLNYFIYTRDYKEILLWLYDHFDKKLTEYVYDQSVKQSYDTVLWEGQFRLKAIIQDNEIELIINCYKDEDQYIVSFEDPEDEYSFDTRALIQRLRIDLS